MTKISTYPAVTPVGTDKVIGTDVDSSNATKNFTIQGIADFAATSGVAGYTVYSPNPIVGGTSSPAAGEYVFIGAGTHVCTLPTAASVGGKLIGVILTVTPDGAATVVVDTTGAETINGAASQALATQYTSYTFISDGTNWFIAN